ncbi:metal-dependent hydrolase [Fundicoccus sp. Sow4_D5]|uniref:metal-dependent hydrolase n=1 Tax=Fundicoccus sp. Sow4_D5 TaxID=3438782 RepID=UPI003F93BC26
MKVAFHGHAVVSVVTHDGTKLLFDPFITGHEQCDLNLSKVEVDVILVTHAHADHLGDTIELAKRTGAHVISTVEIVSYLSSQGLNNVHGMQPGGAHNFPFGRIKFTPAIHGSSITLENGKPYELGLAAGILLTADNQTVYHLGDTALYSDMQLIGNREAIDLAFVPIGDNFTMGLEDAILATEWLQAKRVVPIHYNTFPLIEQDPYAFINRLPEGVGYVPKLGEFFEL